MTTSRSSESTSLLRASSPPSTSQAADVDLDIDLDELPIITRTNSFSLASPSFQHHVSMQHLKVETDADYEDEPEPEVYDEFRKLMTLVFPVVATYVLEYLPGMVCIMLVGHIDSPHSKEYVDAATMSTMFTNVSALSIGFGLSSALDTLCSQAYGAGRLKKIGIYLQSAMIVVGSCLLPIFLLNWHSGYFLLIMGQDAEVARYSGEFSRYTMWGIPFLFVYEMCRKLMQAQNITKPLVIIMVCGNLVNVISGYYLTYHTSLGFHGAALSRTLGYVTLPVLLIPYFIMSPSYKQWWPGWNLKEAWSHVGLFLRLGIPGLLMMAMEWWAYEILGVMAGLLPDGVVSISAHAVLMNVASSLYMFYLGIAVSGNIRVGNSLGANLPKKARMISRITLSICFSLSVILASLVAVYRYEIPKLLMNDPEAIERAAQCLLVMVPYEVVDALNCVIQGIYRGTGRQNMAAKTNAIAFYIVGVPLAGVLAFHFNFGVEGLWIGFMSGIITAFSVCSTILYHSSWQQMAKEAQERTAH
uniref:Uncharacterized protein n=1 Tax=Globisporangium ultimum (strain ATCC 200006 / CBS 805.95 / DAOM BR144) TaxID=431595 RepID=K3WXD6_GLOUD